MASRKDEDGRARRGSQCQLQLYVNVPARRIELDREVLVALPTLQAAGATALRWRSPLWEPLFDDDKPFHEYRDGKMLRAIRRPDLRTNLAEYWPARGPTWDAIAEALDSTGAAVGSVLVEAKSYPGEFRDVGGGTAAKGESRRRIAARLSETRSWLGAPQGREQVELWLGELYQTANRLAFLRWFRAVLEPPVPVWLLNVYFVGDETFRATSREEWEQALTVAVSELGVTCPVAHLGHAFLAGRDRTELVEATSKH